MRADHPGHYQLPGKVDLFFALARRQFCASLDDVTRCDPQIRSINRDRIKSYKRCFFEKV
jgi:hypothetical protein